jgi:hypothetical protein
MLLLFVDQRFQLLHPGHQLPDRLVLLRVRALQRRRRQLHLFDVPLQWFAAQCRDLPLKAGNVPLVLELLLLNRRPQLLNDAGEVARTLLHKKSGGSLPECREFEFFAERIEV